MSLRTLLGGVAFACVAGRAEAADSSLRLSIPARPYADALIELGVQANISILGTANCGPDGHAALSGRYRLEDALRRLLSGAPCTYQLVDSRTVRIIPILPAPGEARHEPSHATNLVAELVVTATKRPATLDSLAASVSALPREQLTASGAVEVGQTVGQLAGVITTNLGPGRDKLLIRGLSDGAFTGRARSTVSTYLDHAPINYNAPDPDLRLVDIDRVEVARGPQGALYGSGAVSGIYRIVTRKPDLERAEFGGIAGYATTRGGDPSHEYEAYASLPVIKDRFAIRVAGYDDIQGGYLDDVNLRIANVDQTRRQGGRVAVRLRFNDNWRLDALAATQSLKSDDSQYVTMTLASGNPNVPREAQDPALTDGGGAPDQRANQVREGHRNNFDYVGAQLQGDFDWGSVSSSVSYVHHVFSSQYDASETLKDPKGAFNTIQADLGVYTEATRSDILVQDLVIHSAQRGRLDWLAGVYAAHTNEHNPSTVGLLSAGSMPMIATAYTENRKDRVSERAVYGEATYDLGGGWSATAGGRLFQTRVHTSADIVVIQPYPSRSFDAARTFRSFSPKISLQRTFSNGDLIYGLITEGYRPGGFNSSGFFAIPSNRATFQSDRLRNYEVGAKVRRFDGRLAIRAAAYYDDWRNFQTDQYRPSGLAYTANVGDARIMGLEAEVEAQVTSGLSLQLNGLISDSKIKNPNPDFTPLVAGALPGVPKASGGLLAIYQRRLTDRFTLRLLGEASYVGSAGLSFSAPRQMDHYWRTTLSAEVATEHWRLMTYVTNPFNESG
ncbi:MAG TPA: TonB-dependent receptor, partial [Phenylobacterium sp.]|nr:TonB-dependent receptor [Phenylobacterium sp.]